MDDRRNWRAADWHRHANRLEAEVKRLKSRIGEARNDLNAGVYPKDVWLMLGKALKGHNDGNPIE